MFAKLFEKLNPMPPNNAPEGSEKLKDLEATVSVHYGIPCTASILAFDPIQQLLAIGTLDGRIKVIGGSNVEGLLFSPKPLPFKNLEFLQNQGFLVGISNGNEIQVISDLSAMQFDLVKTSFRAGHYLNLLAQWWRCIAMCFYFEGTF